MRGHFPFCPPILTTLLMSGVLAVWNLMVIHTTAQFEDPAKQRQECQVVVLLAKQSSAEFEERNALRTAKGWAPYLIGFSPILRNVSSEGYTRLLPSTVPDRWRGLLILVPPLDCTNEFRAQGLPILRALVYGQDGEPKSIRIMFSRIIFSPDNREAYLESSWMCDGECGEGFDTTWRYQNGRWLILRKRAVWIS